MKPAIRTKQLELIPANRQIPECDLWERTGLARLLHAAVPLAWPPPLMDENAIREFIRLSTVTA